MRREEGAAAYVDVSVTYGGRTIKESFGSDTTLRDIERHFVDLFDVPVSAGPRVELHFADTPLRLDEKRTLADLDINADRELHLDMHVELREPKQVQVTINSNPYEIEKGKHTVAEIKGVGGVPLADQLNQIKDGKPLQLADDSEVKITGGEEFYSKPRSSGSS